ncbi:MAG TPA: RNA methyltransferase [Firmicutes bacterium]|nr:RNA methyltransferase [Bacillota bacterium]
MNQPVSAKSRIIREYKLLGKSRHRKKTGRVILEGKHLLQEALHAGIEPEAVLYTPAFLDAPGNKELLDRVGRSCCYQLSESIFNAIAQTESPQGVGAITGIAPADPKFLWRRPNPFLLVLDRLQDPGNLGAIVRTAAAAAVDGILLLSGTVDPTNPKALRASMGGFFYLPVISAGEFPYWLDIFAERGIRLVAADPRGEVPYYELDFSGPTALIIGNESRGVSASLLERAEDRAYIPLWGKVTSLNAAVAAALFIFERQRCLNVRSSL